MTKNLLTILLLSVLLLFFNKYTNAQKRHFKSGNYWYAGVKGGVPFGFSTFTSFAADKTHIGTDFGLYGGYILNPKFSVEAFISFGQIGMSAHDNVEAFSSLDQNDMNANKTVYYWLGSDGKHYFVPVSGMEGHNYSDLYSDVKMQRYGLKFNIELLQLSSQTSKSRWTIQVSPSLSAVIADVEVKQIANNVRVLDGRTNIHIGIGGELSIGYRITDHLGIHIYGGANYLTGERFDGMPEHLHTNNFTLDNGVKISWRFLKDKYACLWGR